jgi:6-phosphofructokinase 1
VRKRTGLQTRVTVLGHIQRGGTPTVKDRLLGTMFGSRAVEALIHGDTSKIVGLSGNRLCLFDIEEVVSKRKPIDEEMYRVATLLSGM